MSFHKILFLVCLTPWLSGLSAQDVETTQAPDTLRLRLDEAIQIALTENPTVRVADYDVEIKKEARREAVAGGAVRLVSDSRPQEYNWSDGVYRWCS